VVINPFANSLLICFIFLTVHILFSMVDSAVQMRGLLSAVEGEIAALKVSSAARLNEMRSLVVKCHTSDYSESTHRESQ